MRHRRRLDSILGSNRSDECDTSVAEHAKPLRDCLGGAAQLMQHKRQEHAIEGGAFE